ncbi:MAG: hypothetical protein EON55_02985 [Alphaproteobacteria bacterium]|nr:MAG: hypothetical protein EON55_02985 [Alphaproteobacteria bacterium]
MSDDIHAAEPTAALLLANARGFLRAPFHSSDRDVSDEQLHMVAISVELALKAALIAAGVSDRWNRDYIGHDLAKAADHAADFGFAVRERVRALIGIIHPHFINGGFHHCRRHDCPKFARYARTIAAGLIDDVDRAIGNGLTRPNRPSPREERADDGR